MAHETISFETAKTIKENEIGVFEEFNPQTIAPLDMAQIGGKKPMTYEEAVESVWDWFERRKHI
jgi:hypothetical protein